MKKKNLQPVKITKDCIQAEITFDTVAVIRSDHSLWLLHPLTSEMYCKLRKRQREGRRPYWDETEFGPQPKFKKLMENVSMISAAAMTLAVVKTDGTLLVWDRMQSGCEDRPDFVKIADGIKTAETGSDSSDCSLLYVNIQVTLPSHFSSQAQAFSCFRAGGFPAARGCYPPTSTADVVYLRLHCVWLREIPGSRVP